MKIEDKLINSSVVASANEDSTIQYSTTSLSAIKKRKEINEKLKVVTPSEIKYADEPFSETDMLLFWNKFSQKLEERGQRILFSLMALSSPKLEQKTIIYELPNEGSKIDFEAIKPELLGYLRGMLHNHFIELELKVNETIEPKKLVTIQDKYKRFKEINPLLEELRKTFDLEL